jgi:Protein of unknown function (DUF2510)
MTSTLPPPGWYPDSTVSGQQRYWDGRAWTEHTAPTAGPNRPTPSPPAQGSQGPEARLAVATPTPTPTPTSSVARKRQRAIEQAQPLLPPGTRIRQIISAQTGSPLLYIVLMLLLAILPGALLFLAISKNRLIVVAADAIYVLDCGHLGMTPKRVLRVLPRSTRLGPLGGVWTKIHAGPDTLWAGRDADIAAADAEAAGYGVPTVLPAGYGAPAFLPAASKSPVLHAVASFFIPGLGTLLCGKTARGLLILGLSAVSLFGVTILADALIGGEPTGIGGLLAIPLWFWGMIDGYRSARQWNLERVGEAELPVEKAGQASSDPLDVAPTQDSTAADEPDSGVTIVGLLRDFLIRNQEDVKLADIDALREIVNSGCSPAVVQRHRAYGDGVVQEFLDELAEHGFISSTPQ